MRPLALKRRTKKVAEVLVNIYVTLANYAHTYELLMLILHRKDSRLRGHSKLKHPLSSSIRFV